MRKWLQDQPMSENKVHFGETFGCGDVSDDTCVLLRLDGVHSSKPENPTMFG
jgi:hypothetical protein